LNDADQLISLSGKKAAAVSNNMERTGSKILEEVKEEIEGINIKVPKNRSIIR
jgi:hypothetical protein